MEVFLNSIWLVAAISAFLLWPGEREPERREHNSRYRFLALACALVMLFPVISLTDDLHAEQAAMEDSSRSVMKARNMVQGCPRAGSSSFLAVVTHAPYSAAPLHLFLGTVVLIETRVLCLTQISTHEGRSPPSNV
jgi:choline-glycine betaine transporter